MPLPKWMKHEKNRPFEPHKKARKQENFYSDFNLEIRTISPGSNSLGTESFLSSDSFSSEKISVDLVYKENTNPSVPPELNTRRYCSQGKQKSTKEQGQKNFTRHCYRKRRADVFYIKRRIH